MSTPLNVQINLHLVKLGFLATQDGKFIKIEKSRPFVVFYDWSKSVWIIERDDYTGTFETIPELEYKLHSDIKHLNHYSEVN